MTTQEIAEKYAVAQITVLKWAAANDVTYTGKGRRKTYLWMEEDCMRFENRGSPGWKKGRPRKEMTLFPKEENIKVTIKKDPEREKFIHNTKLELEKKIGADFMIDYIGDLAWVVRPKLKNSYFDVVIKE